MARDFIDALIEQAEDADEGDTGRRQAAIQLYELFVDAAPGDGANPATTVNVDPRLVAFVAKRLRQVVDGSKSVDALLLKNQPHRSKSDIKAERDQRIIEGYYRARLRDRRAEDIKEEIAAKEHMTANNVERIIGKRTLEQLLPLALQLPEEDQRRKLFQLAFPETTGPDS